MILLAPPSCAPALRITEDVLRQLGHHPWPFIFERDADIPLIGSIEQLDPSALHLSCSAPRNSWADLGALLARERYVRRNIISVLVGVRPVALGTIAEEILGGLLASNPPRIFVASCYDSISAPVAAEHAAFVLSDLLRCGAAPPDEVLFRALVSSPPRLGCYVALPGQGGTRAELHRIGGIRVEGFVREVCA